MTHHLNRNDERPPTYDPDGTLEPDSIDRNGNRYPRWREYEASQSGRPKGVTADVPF